MQETVIDLVNVGKIINRLTDRVLVIEAHFVVKDGVEANVLEIGGLLNVAHVAAVAVAQGEDRPARPEHLFPEMREGVSGGVEINLDRVRRSWGLSGQWGDLCDEEEGRQESGSR